MKKTEVIIVLLISSILVVVINVLLLLDPNPNEKWRVCSHIILSIWGFSIVPSFMFFRQWLNEKSFEKGAKIGNFLKLGILFIPVIIAPYWMIKYYVCSFKKQV